MNPEPKVSPLAKKLLQSGLVDRASVELLERWKLLPEGTASITREDALQGATREVLTKITEELAEEVEKEHKIRETYLDLELTKWPVVVAIYGQEMRHTPIVMGVPAMMDHMDRLYFRFPDVKKEWLTPGFVIERTVSRERGFVDLVKTTILEVTPLFIGEKQICWQVTAS